MYCNLSVSANHVMKCKSILNCFRIYMIIYQRFQAAKGSSTLSYVNQ